MNRFLSKMNGFANEIIQFSINHFSRNELNFKIFEIEKFWFIILNFEQQILNSVGASTVVPTSGMPSFLLERTV